MWNEPFSGPPVKRGRNREYLDWHDFLLTVAAAVGLHAAAVAAWQMLPKIQIIEIPVRVLNIKLGEGETLNPEEMKEIKGISPPPAHAPEPPLAKSAPEELPLVNPDEPGVALNKAITPPRGKFKEVRESSRPQSREKIVGNFDRREEGRSTAAPVMGVTAHNVRELDPPTPALPQEVKSAALYQQKVVDWLKKFRSFPSGARPQDMENPILYVSIDRKGNILDAFIERSSGYRAYDEAAMEMARAARKAGAVPPPPPDYRASRDVLPMDITLDFDAGKVNPIEAGHATGSDARP